MVRSSGLFDLDELVLRCHSPAARDYIDEAVKAYKVGAYRSCIIATWIAVYFDLAAKFRSLALAGSQEADEWIRNFERHSKAYDPSQAHTAAPLLRVESEILNKASNEFDLLSPMELSDLKRLREDRNRCAHPTMLNATDTFAPSAELARTHLRTAIEHVLAKPAILGQLAVDRLLDILRDEGFPVVAEQARQVIGSTDFERLDEASIGSVIKALFADVMDISTESGARLQRVVALEAIRNVVPQHFTSAFKEAIDLALRERTSMTWRIIIAISRTRTWIPSFLSIIQLNQLSAAIKSADVEDPIEARLIIDALHLEGFSAVAEDRLPDFKISQLVQHKSHIPIPTLIGESLRRLRESTSFGDSYQLMTELLEPCIRDFQRSDVTSCLSACRSNPNVSGSYAISRFFTKILETCDHQTLGLKSVWEWTIDSITTLNDNGKSDLRAKVVSAFSMNDVPF